MKRASAVLVICLLFVTGCFVTGGKGSLPTDPKTATEILEASFNREVRRRGIKKEYKNFLAELKTGMEGTDQAGTGDRTGKCRLRWVETLVEDPTQGVRTAERFTRDLFAAAGSENFESILNFASEKLEAQLGASTEEKQRSSPPVSNDPLTIVVGALQTANEAIRKAFAPLSGEEQSELREKLYRQTTGGVDQGYLFADKDQGRRVADLLEKVNRTELIGAANALLSLADRKFLDRLADTIRPQQTERVRGIDGRILQRIETPDGLIIVGGAESNVYNLDELGSVAGVIDIGGDDQYREGSLNENRRALIVIDLAGDDTYSGQTPGIQGGAIMGASLLVDARGNDTYIAGDVAQGSALAGAGMLVDLQGNDRYRGDRRVQGQAIDGFGLLFDRKGDDHYRAAMLSQAAGGPLGFGSLIDVEGNDDYFAGGKYPDPYQDSPGFGGWSQGVGIGAKGTANGGIGVLLDGTGSDVYQADYFSNGGGYWFGAGIARDFAGDDRRIGATTENFDGSPRIEPRFLRWGIGFACHYAAGFSFDDDGDDLYQGDWASIAFSWDFAVAALCDFHGNDRYLSTGSGVAQSRNLSIAFLYDTSGDDSYEGKGLGEAEENRKHSTSGKENSFAFLLDSNGKDAFGKDLQNDSNATRGWKGGIFIDR